MGPGDDAGRHNDNNNDDGHDHEDDPGFGDDYEAGDGDKDDTGSDHPKVDWGRNALDIWRKSRDGGGAWFFVKWLGMNHAKIINKRRKAR